VSVLFCDLVGVDSTFPLADNALCTCRAQFAEADGEHRDAARGYAEAVERRRAFGRVTELAYALLGQGRCLLAVGDAGAEDPLAEARDLFVSMGYQPALAETEGVLAETVAEPA
jgi:hypothetical protein